MSPWFGRDLVARSSSESTFAAARPEHAAWALGGEGHEARKMWRFQGCLLFPSHNCVFPVSNTHP